MQNVSDDGTAIRARNKCVGTDRDILMIMGAMGSTYDHPTYDYGGHDST